MIEHACHSSTRETEVEGSEVQGQYRPHSETLFLRKTEQKFTSLAMLLYQQTNMPGSSSRLLSHGVLCGPRFPGLLPFRIF